MVETALKSGLISLNINPQYVTSLLLYIELLEKWNKVYNLTAIRERSQIVSKHIFDSLSILPHIQGHRLLDIGTGAGLPGLVLAIVQPNLHCVLLDSNAKKTRFLQQAIIALQLNNVDIVTNRIEQYVSSDLFNTITCRAYSNLQDFYQQAIHLCAPEGKLLAMKGEYPQDEIAKLQSQHILVQTVALHVPQLNAERHLVILN